MLSFMIGFACNVKYPSKQLEGLSFSVSAKAAQDSPLTPAEYLEQVRLMMRAVLADSLSVA